METNERSNKELLFSDNNSVVTANKIIMGRQNTSLQAARLIRLVISQIAMGDTELYVYRCKITDLAKFFGVSKSNMYRDIKDICETLQKSFVSIQTGDPKMPWKNISWLSMSEYDGRGNITLTLSDTIRPYVLALNKSFTQYNIKNILSMKSFYAIRLYEVINCEDKKGYCRNDKIEFTISELRTYMGCEDQFTRFYDFKRFVIERAVEDINKHSDIELTPEYKKTGRTVESVIFTIRENKEPDNSNSPYFQFVNKD